MYLNTNIFGQCVCQCEPVYVGFAWDPGTEMPQGWKGYGLGTYSSGNTAANAGKFDHQHDSLSIHTDTTLKLLVYSIKGNSLKPPYLFVLLESVDGLWYDTLMLHSADTMQLSTKYNTFKVIPKNESRYFRFEYLQKTGGNIALDDIALYADAATTLSNAKGGIYKITHYDDIIQISNASMIQEVFVYDMSGKQVGMQKGNQNSVMHIQTENLIAGVYLFVINNGIDIQTVKYIK